MTEGTSPDDAADTAVARFLDWFEGNTRKAYAGDLKVLFGWCAASGIDPLMIDGSQLAAFKLHLVEERAESVFTVRRRLGVAESFRSVQHAGRPRSRRMQEAYYAETRETAGVAMRRCPRCDEFKPLDEFYEQKRDKRPKVHPCRECNRLYQLERIGEQTAYIRKVKLESGCVDCGLRTDVAEVYEFDHLPGAKKLFNVAQARLRPMQLLIAEIAKCEVVCANCHRIRTVRRRAENGANQTGWPARKRAAAIPTLFDLGDSA